MMPSFYADEGTVEVSRRWVASDVGRLRQRWSNAAQRMKARRKKTSESGEKARWYDFLDIFTFGEDFGVIALILGVVLALVLVWFVALPLLVPLLGLLGQLAWLLILIPIVFTWKVLGRRPWMVDAISQDGHRIATWKVTGWFASGRLEREIVASGTEGIPWTPSRPTSRSLSRGLTGTIWDRVASKPHETISSVRCCPWIDTFRMCGAQ